MPNILNADTGAVSGISGLTTSADNSGVLQFQTSGTATLEISTAGNINIPGTGKRITGDFSNATIANRLAFQNSTANSATVVNILPSGTGTASGLVAYNNSDPTNSAYIRLFNTGTEGAVQSAINGTGTYLPLTMYTGGSERMRIDTSGNVGIGTSSPGSFAKLIVQQTSGSNNFQIGTTTNAAGMYWISTNAYGVQQYSYGGLLALGTSDSNHLEFRTNATERMRIDSSGNVGIGITPSAWVGRALEIGFLGSAIQTSASGFMRVMANAYQGSGGNFFYAASATRPALYEQNLGQHTFYTANTGTANNAISFTQALNLNTNGALALQGGVSNATGVGITFPATQSASSNANTLDDYEEGSFTPTPGGGSNTFSGTYTGSYTKVGNVVTVHIQINLSAKSGSDGITIALPFVVAGTRGGLSFGMITNATFMSSSSILFAQMDGGVASVNLRTSTNGASWSAFTPASISASTEFQISGSYITS